MRIVTTCLLIAFTCLALSVSVSGVAKAEEKAKKKPDPAKMFEKKDADGDGALTLDEFKKGMKDKQLEGCRKTFQETRRRWRWKSHSRRNESRPG